MSDNALEKVKEYFRNGNAFYTQGNFDRAVKAYRQALTIHTAIPEIYANLGAALHALGRTQEAQEALQEALRLKPGYADALNTLGNSYKSNGNSLRAAEAYLRAAESEPGHLVSWLNLGQILHQMKDFIGSIAAYEKVLTLDPGNLKALGELTSMLHLLCRWDHLPQTTARLQQAIKNGGCTEPFVAALYVPELTLENARRYTAKLYPQGLPYNSLRPLPAAKRKDGKLRIGYVSADFNRHATAYLISELFERHDRNRFEIYAYSHGLDDASAERTRIINAVDIFRDIRDMGDTAAARVILADEVDILVDLKGYTLDHRLGILAQRPAPIQMHYLGYPATTGASFIDYFVADSVVAPEYTQKDFCENLIRLPHSYQINDRRRPLAQNAKPRSEYGLPAEGLVFCGFNQSFKITADMFALWMRLLKEVKGSVLWLYETNPEASTNLKLQAKALGVDPARIVIAPRMPPDEHLARHTYADLFLDTAPCNAHTTASDALWCGVPLVTLAGKHFFGRVAASLLHAVGLPELVTEDLAAYEALALSIARDKAKRMALREHLTNGRMDFPLFDSVATTRVLETAYEHAAKLHREGITQTSFAVSAAQQVV